MIDGHLENWFKPAVPMWRVREADDDTEYLQCPSCFKITWDRIPVNYCETCGQHFNGSELY